MFSLIHALSSSTSADGCPSLFGWFIGTMARSDSSGACMSDVRFCIFSDRPRPRLGQALQRSPGSRACCFSACAGSQTTQDRLITRV